MITSLVRNILQGFTQIVPNTDRYDYAFTALCILIPVITYTGIICAIVYFLKGWFKK